MCILLTGCDGWRKKNFRKYTLENGTQHELKINFYINSVFVKTNSIIGKGTVSEGISNDGVGRAMSPYDAFTADSIVVIFDDIKRQIYTVKVVKNRNILVDLSYQVESDKLYRFTFTEEDYTTAEDL